MSECVSSTKLCCDHSVVLRFSWFIMLANVAPQPITGQQNIAVRVCVVVVAVFITAYLLVAA